MTFEELTIFMNHLPTSLNALINNNKIATHDGIFHATDVFATALIALICEKDDSDDQNILDFWLPQRINNEEAKNFDGLLFDVGNEFDVLKLHFDHRQENSPRYKDDVKMTAFGMLSILFIPEIWGWAVYMDLKEFIKTIDEYDEHSEPVKITDFSNNAHHISSIIYNMNKTWDEGDEKNDEVYFKNAVKMAYTILKRLIINSLSQRIADSMAEMFYSEIPETNRFKVLVLDRYLPWKSSMMEKEDVIGAIYPSDSGGWNLEVKNPETYHLPDKWLSDEYKPEGMTFIHQALFLANFETKQQAQTAAEAFISCC